MLIANLRPPFRLLHTVMQRHEKRSARTPSFSSPVRSASSPPPPCYGSDCALGAPRRRWTPRGVQAICSVLQKDLQIT